MNLNHLDLNLLTAFEALFRERSVTRAAARMNITQPAMSNALRRLRLLLDDPLFVRSSEGMAPTPRALALGPKIEAALAALREAVSVTGFDPASSTIEFILGSIDSLEALLMPRLIADLEKAGPGLSLRVRRLEWLFEIPQQALESGIYDCALGTFPWPLPPQASLLGQMLGREDQVGVVRREHPSVSGPLTLEEYAALPHLAISYPGISGSGLIDRALAERGLTRRRVATLPHFLTLAHHVAGSDCIATLPRALGAEAARMLDLQLVEIPDFIPPINISLIWHPRVDKDPAQMWFRARVAEAVKKGCGA